MKKPTIKQQLAFKLMLEKLIKHEPIVLKTIMREVGYSTNTAINPGLNMTSKPGWELLKRELDAGGARDAFNELVAPSNEDKRTRLSAAIEIMKIVSPEKQTNVIGLFEKIGELQESQESQEDDKPETITDENQLPASPGATESSSV